MAVGGNKQFYCKNIFLSSSSEKDINNDTYDKNNSIDKTWFRQNPDKNYAALGKTRN